MFFHQKHNTNADYINSVEPIINGLKNGTYKPYQFYHTQFSITENSWLRYNNAETKFVASQGKKLNKTYYDIETYVKIGPEAIPFNAKYHHYPVNAVALYNNILNEVQIIYVRIPEFHPQSNTEIEEAIKEIYKEKCLEKTQYLIPELKIKTVPFSSEVDLLIYLFNTFKELNHHILMGFNSENFDDPYIIKRLKKLRPNDWEDLISEFGQVQSFGELSYEFPDYNLVDLLVLYKPVDAGGNGFGKSLPDFTLNTICRTHLDLEKLDLDEDFVYSYEKNITNYLAYNMLDTLLVYKLDEKLRFIEQIFSLAEINKAPLGATIRGRSLMFSARNNKHFTDKGNILRHGKFGSEIYYKIDK